MARHSSYSLHLFRGRGGRHQGSGNSAVRGRGGFKPGASNVFSPLSDDSQDSDTKVQPPPQPPDYGNASSQIQRATATGSNSSQPATNPRSVKSKFSTGNQVGAIDDSSADAESDSSESGTKYRSTSNRVQFQDAPKVFDKTTRPSTQASQTDAHKVFDSMPMHTLPTDDNDGQDATTTWASLVKNRDINNGAKLRHVPVEGKRVKVKEHQLDDVEKAWGYCLAGHFASKFPDKQALSQLCDTWNVPYKFFAHATGWIVLKFEKEEHWDLFHIRVLESTQENINVVLMSLEYLINIAYVDDTEVFKMPLLEGLVDGLGPQFMQRRRRYAVPMSKLRLLMISRMAKPEEVLIVEEENGYIVRETMTDNDVLVQYKIMKETLICLAHLDHEDIEKRGRRP